MLDHVSPVKSASTLALVDTERAAATHALAASVLADMRDHGILPSPRNYDLWFTYRADMNPALTDRVRLVLDEGQALTPAVLDTLYDECVSSTEMNVDAIGTHSDAIQEAAQTLIDQVASSQAAVATYGDTLSDWAQHLGDQPTLAGLVDAIASIAAETARASERNRLLEQQLSASAGRIAKLRQSLAAGPAGGHNGRPDRAGQPPRLRRQDQALHGAAALRAGHAAVASADRRGPLQEVQRHPRPPRRRPGAAPGRARLMADNVKGRDTVARYGGEEFAILLAGADMRAACVVARQLGETLSSKRLVTKGSVHPVGPRHRVDRRRPGPAGRAGRRPRGAGPTPRSTRPSAPGATACAPSARRPARSPRSWRCWNSAEPARR